MTGWSRCSAPANSSKMIGGWVTFHGLDDQVKWPSLSYHPMWEPNAFAAGLADDLSADLGSIGGDKNDDAEAKEQTPALKAPQEVSKKAAKARSSARSRKRIVRRRLDRTSRIVSKDPLASASLRHGKTAGASLSEARRVLKKSPGNGEAHYLLGWAQVQMGTFQAARQSLSKATSLGAPPDA